MNILNDIHLFKLNISQRLLYCTKKQSILMKRLVASNKFIYSHLRQELQIKTTRYLSGLLIAKDSSTSSKENPLLIRPVNKVTQ